MPSIIDIQHATDKPVPISDNDLSHWAKTALKHLDKTGELTLRLVTLEEIQALNHQYRNKNKPTNVLSFPANLPAGISLEVNLLGDILICPDVLQLESTEFNKPLPAHWAHIVVHGVLHLLGYDHIKDEDAKIMQPLETAILEKLGFENPYDDEEA